MAEICNIFVPVPTLFLFTIRPARIPGNVSKIRIILVSIKFDKIYRIIVIYLMDGAHVKKSVQTLINYSNKNGFTQQLYFNLLIIVEQERTERNKITLLQSIAIFSVF